MNLIDEAVIIEIFGIRMYAFGLYVALGALCAVLVLGVVSSWLRLKKGTAELTALLSGLCGLIVSRLAFCLLNQELGSLTLIPPVYAAVAGSRGGKTARQQERCDGFRPVSFVGFWYLAAVQHEPELLGHPTVEGVCQEQPARLFSQVLRSRHG